MSSEVLRADDPAPVEALQWRSIEMPPPPEPAPPEPVVEDHHDEIALLREEMARRVRDAKEQGRREGEAAGHTQGAAEVRPVIDRLAHAIDEIGGLRARLRREAEADTIQLALAIARRILHRQLAIDPEALHGLVLAALEKLDGQEVARVRVHPSQAPLVNASLEQGGTGTPVEVLADPSREPGTVIFETARGDLDASIETQLQEISRGLADCLRRQP
jgi:flagellar assembly protein FliH